MRIKHGHCLNYECTPEYRAWTHIKDRCINQRDKRYHDYGGRGIKMCERWVNSFENFLEDMGHRPSINHSIDRFPNNDGDYEPGNCRWATPAQQLENRRNTIFIEYQGRKYTIRQLAQKLGESIDFIRRRYVRGHKEKKRPNIDAIMTLLEKGIGEAKQLRELSGLSKDAVSNALQPLKRKGVIKKIGKVWYIINTK